MSIPDEGITKGEKAKKLLEMIDEQKWMGALYGMYAFTITEQKNWTSEENIDYFIACEINRCLQSGNLRIG